MAAYLLIFLCLVLALGSPPSFARNPCKSRELDKGVAAVVRGDIAAGIKVFMPMATRGCAEAMHNMGVVTSMMSHHGPGPDGRNLRVDAYMWFTLAAEHHPPGERRVNSLQNRTSVVDSGSMTSEQIAEGERLSKAWRAGQKLPPQKLIASKFEPTTIIGCTMPDGSKISTTLSACSQSGGKSDQ